MIGFPRMSFSDRKRGVKRLGGGDGDVAEDEFVAIDGGGRDGWNCGLGYDWLRFGSAHDEDVSGHARRIEKIGDSAIGGDQDKLREPGERGRNCAESAESDECGGSRAKERAEVNEAEDDAGDEDRERPALHEADGFGERGQSGFGDGENC